MQSDRPEPAPESQATALTALLRGKRIVALTGAGCSTESGIPDYRGPGTRARARNPVQHREFVHDARARQRYWARSMLGWPLLSTARPNAAHLALAKLERAGVLAGIITQNVDRLHHHAGSERVVELHGALAQVRCLACGERVARAELQARLAEANPALSARRAEMAPDGDSELDDEVVRSFRVPGCAQCGGVLKPDVVFFGDNVARPIVESAFALLEEGEALLVVGTSLAVFSGLRFVRRAAELGRPIALVNLGESRGDALAQVRVQASAGETLAALTDALLDSPSGR